MKYSTEDTSACSKKIVVTVEAEEVNAAITAALKMQQQGLSLAGFRKGHVPLNIIESRFKGQIYGDAAQDLTSVHINEILGELKVRPVSAINVDPTPIQLVRGQDTTYTVTFEHMPVFELPAYDGVEVEQHRAAPAGEQHVSDFIERIRRDRSKYVPAPGEGPAADGQMVNIDLDVVDGEKVYHTAHGVDLRVGQPGAEFLDELVKTLKVGESGEKVENFAADFMMPELQGKTATVKVTVHAIKNLDMPDDEALLKAIKLDSMDELKRRAREIMETQANMIYRNEAKAKAVDKVAAMVDFELPPSLLHSELSNMVMNDLRQAERMGKTLSSEQIAELNTKHDAAARERVKSFVLLMAIAEKEGLSVTDQEVQRRVIDEAGQMHIDPNKLFDYYRENGYLYTIRDALLTDKAAEAVYRKAKVNMVEAAPAAETEKAAEAAPAAEAGQAAEAAPAAEAGQAAE